ncbi:uncharacterized protein LOC115362886 isoform X2 [Myripristis murdjan]|uniref:uncharacterized protein LOC115362886 isoform X2 n=1 Tax=Myripristis murdjan TaxID=586833 RepID=UPI00117643D8|nr:uncharacterized protein LOC115362886 isoform X2 [Myripristis murdjan]
MAKFKCSAYNCKSTNASGVTFFKFPLYNRRKLKKWLDNMRWKGWTPSRFSLLCSNHFEEKCIDRTGKFVKLQQDAVPTIFSFPEHPVKKTLAINPRSKRYKPPGSEESQTSRALSLPAAAAAPKTAKLTVKKQKPSETEEEAAGDPKRSDRWRIVTDEALMKIESFPCFFHGDYCLPQDILWAPDDSFNVECEDPEKLIEVKEPWQWLGLDVRGPLPATLNGHKYILTVTDYFSKWVEALPMQMCHASQVAQHVSDIISHFGFPLRILSRLPHDIVHKINRELRDQLKVTISLVVHHQQTGTADLTTQRLIGRMTSDLIEEHPADWDVYLPAKVFSLCFTEHSETKERPFSVLCCRGLQPVPSPRGLNFTYSKIRECAFVVR